VRNSRFAHRELQAAKRTVQHLTHFAVSRYGEYLSTRIQQCADCGDFHGLYSGIREVIGPFAKKVSPLLTADGALLVDTQARNQLGTPRVAKSFLRGTKIFQTMSSSLRLCPTYFSSGDKRFCRGGFAPPGYGPVDTAAQLERWVDHGSSIYSQPAHVRCSALSSLQQLPVLQELDNPFTMEDVKLAIRGIKNKKSPGQDCIPRDFEKCGKPLLTVLFCIFTKCWNRRCLPDDFRDTNIITLYKNKGDRRDCNNYRGISLLCIAGKVFARLLLLRVHQIADRILPESQCGFRPLEIHQTWYFH